MSTNEQMLRNIGARDSSGVDLDVDPFAKSLGIVFTEASEDRVVATMPIDRQKLQPMGALAGGATITLLETVASRAAAERTDFSKERCFGYDVEIHHRKPGLKGMVKGIAEIDHVDGNSQFWTVRALDEAGDTLSYGMIVTKIVSLEYLAQKDEKRRRRS